MSKNINSQKEISEEETRDDIIEILNNEEPVKEEPINEEIKKEIKEEEIKLKAKPKSKARAKPNIKIVKESVVEEPVVEEKPEPVVEEKPAPVKVDKLKEIVKCPDCNMDMTVHTLEYIHKRRSFCKAVKTPEPEKPVPEPVVQPKPKITEDIVNYHIKQNPDIVSNYLRNERAMKAQRKQMNARSLLNNAFQIFYFILLYIIKRCRIRRSKQSLVLFSLN